MTKAPHSRKPRRGKGFASAANLLQSNIRQAGESRGFAVTRLLTQWTEVVGPDIAGIARPVKIGYGRGGFGATLTLLTTGANAPLLQMQAEKIREKVNTCYGYAAISKVRITQTAPTGFAEGQAEFTPAPKPEITKPSLAVQQAAKQSTAHVADPSLRQALESLGENVLSRTKP